MSRIRAAVTHLGLSALVVGAILAAVFLLWYPFPTFRIAGTMNPVAVLVGVDLIVGPLLTLLVYRAGKPGLKFDLAVIALIQISALSYGSWTLWSARPGYLLFVVDRFQLAPARYIDREEVPNAVLESSSGTRLVRAYTALPKDPEASARFWDRATSTGADLDAMPEFWLPLDQNAELVRRKSLRLGDFEAVNPVEKATVEELRKNYAGHSDTLMLAPVGGIEEDLAVLFDSDTLALLDVVPLALWDQPGRRARE